MKVQVLMSTCNQRNLSDVDLESRNITGDCIIVNQYAKLYAEESCDKSMFFSYNEKGLSRSRNRLLENAKDGIGIITDDDITFVEDYEKKIKDSYSKYPNADVITFNIMIGDTMKGSTKTFKHSFLSSMSIASCQISFNIKKIKDKGVKFDESFGLGSTFTSGEENIFLNDCRKSGLMIIHVPIVLCSHPEELTTGERWDQKLVVSKGALSYKLLNYKYFIFLLYFMLTKRKYYRSEMNVLSFFKFFKQGVIECKNEN